VPRHLAPQIDQRSRHAADDDLRIHKCGVVGTLLLVGCRVIVPSAVATVSTTCIPSSSTEAQFSQRYPLAILRPIEELRQRNARAAGSDFVPGRMRIDEFVTMGEYPPGRLRRKLNERTGMEGKIGCEAGATNTPPVLSAIKSALCLPGMDPKM